jgi:hypothetical protein
MLTGEELEARREVVADAADLHTLRDRLLVRTRRVTSRRPVTPVIKGMLSADGGFCPEDRSPLHFDPWSPERHRCPRCGREFQGERHAWRWAWLQHLWLGERIAELAFVGAMADDEEALAWATEQVGEYGRRYLDYPNSDNVLGPSRLFSSTYLESIWLTNYLAGSYILRECGTLDDEGQAAVGRVAEAAADLIGEFDEGLSNRQTWHNAALVAAAVWFEDEDLARRAVEGPRGLVGHLVDGFGRDGMWYEGENYHLFALRGLLIGAAWARLAGVDLFEEEAGRARLTAAFQAPILSALPDGTFPARKDSRFGVSLAQPMYLELWEQGVAGRLAAGELDEAQQLADWLRYLYGLPAPPAELFDSYLHEAGEPAPSARGRSDLSWWMLATMAPELPEARAVWVPGSALLPEQGIAVLRDGDRYVSVECGAYGGGHGHPDRLHLTLHARGVHWLADPGTGSYVSADLFWYRSTMAHNAPRVDGVSQAPVDARAEMYEGSGQWGWVRTRADRFTRTVVAGPTHLVDVVEFAADDEYVVELPWHPEGEVEVLSGGRWESAELADRFARDIERFVPDQAGPIAWRSVEPASGQRLEGVFDGAGELLRARGPGRPGRSGEKTFLILRQRGRYARFATVLAFDEPALKGARFAPGEIVVETDSGTVSHRQSSEGWEVEASTLQVSLRGLRRELPTAVLSVPVVGREFHKYTPPVATAFHVAEPPALDGTLTGFVIDEPLVLDHEDQYRRTEEPYPGHEVFSARAWLAWDETALYVAVHVTKEELVFRSAEAAPLHLDNEADLIHADGLQLYLQAGDRWPCGWLVVPDPSGETLQVRGIAGTAGQPAEVRGGWRRLDDGYSVTLALSLPGWPPGPGDEPPAFDLIVNEIRPGRLRRLGQLVWTGGGGWAYLRGDRQDPARFGRIALA